MSAGSGTSPDPDGDPGQSCETARAGKIPGALLSHKRPRHPARTVIGLTSHLDSTTVFAGLSIQKLIFMRFDGGDFTKLHELRQQAHLTQLQLAEAVNVTQSAVSAWEHGKGAPLRKWRKVMAKHLHVTVDELEAAIKETMEE